MKKGNVKKEMCCNKTITKKTNMKKEILMGVISALVFTLVLYLIITKFNYEMTLILRALEDNKLSKFEMLIWIFCVSVTVNLSLRIGKFFIECDK